MINWLRARFGKQTTGGGTRAPLIDVGGSNWWDGWRSRPRPKDADLVRSYQGLVYSFANINATAFAAVPMKMYVTTTSGQRRPKCSSRPVSRHQYAWLKSQAHLAGRVEKAVVIEEVDSHPMLDLLAQVNSTLNGYDLFELVDLYQEMLGNAYWYVPRTNGGLLTGRPEAIWILLSQHVDIKTGNDGQLIRAYEYGNGSDRMVFPPEDIIHFRFPSLVNPYLKGMAPAEAAWRSVSVLDKQYGYMDAQMDNRARPDAVLTPKEPIGKDEANRLEFKINRKFRRGGAGGLMVTEEAYNVVPLGFTSKDMEMLAFHGVSKEELANIYSIPIPFVVRESNLANMQAARELHARLAILPRCRRFDEKINAELVPLYDDSGRLFVVHDNPVPEDIQLRTVVQGADLTGSVKTVNEVREDRGLPPVEWGDKPWMNAMLIQPGQAMPDIMGMSQSTATPAAPAEPINPAATDGQGGSGQQIQTTQDAVLNGAQITAATGIVQAVVSGEIPRDAGIGQLIILFNLKPEQAEQIMGSAGMANVPTTPNPKPITAQDELAAGANQPPPKTPPKGGGKDNDDDGEAAKKGSGLPSPFALTDSLLKASRHHGRQLPSGTDIEVTMVGLFRQQATQVFRQIGAVQKSASIQRIDMSGWTPEMVKAARPLIEMYVSKGGQYFMARNAVSTERSAWNVQLPQVKQAIDQMTFAFCDATNKTTTMELAAALEQLRSELQQGIVHGDNTIDELTRRVSSVFTNAEKFRARRIAVTEASRAVHTGQAMAARESGLVKGFKWLLSPDACPICQAIHAHNPGGVLLGQAFANGIEFPPAHPNCMCTVTEILSDIAESTAVAEPAPIDIDEGEVVQEPDTALPPGAPTPMAPPSSTPDSQREAMATYMSKQGFAATSIAINYDLRAMVPLTPEDAAVVKELDKLIASQPPLPPGTKLYRMVDTAQATPMDENHLINDRAFMATSENRESAVAMAEELGLEPDEYTILEMEIGGEIRGVRVSDVLPDAKFEGEVLLERGTNYRMTDADAKHGNAVRVVITEADKFKPLYVIGEKPPVVVPAVTHAPLPGGIYGDEPEIERPDDYIPPMKDGRFVDAADWAMNMVDVDPSASTAIEGWTVSNYESIRRYQMTGQFVDDGAFDDEESLKEAIEAIERGISDAPLATNTIYRGIVVSDDDLQKIIGGGTIKLRAFESWSTNRSISEGFAGPRNLTHHRALFKLKAPKTGAYIAAASSAPEEKEVMMSPGATLRIGKIRRPPADDPRGYVIIEVEELGK